MRKSRTILVLLLLIRWGVLFSQAGGLDPSFGSGGIVVSDVGLHDFGYGVALQPDGRILVAGSAAHALTVLRYLTNGELDGSFGDDGVFSLSDPGTQSFLSKLTLQSDGRILAAGYVRPDSADSDMAVVRLLPDGTLDSTFGSNGLATIDFFGEDDYAYSIAIQEDNKVIIGGTSRLDSIFGASIVRLNPDGGLDPTFGSAGLGHFPYMTNAVEVLGLQTDGRIVAFIGGDNEFKAARFYPDCAPDSSFGTWGTSYANFGSAFNYSWPADMLVLPDDKILMAGTVMWEFQSSWTCLAGVARANADGTPDSGFGADGCVTAYLTQDVYDFSYTTTSLAVEGSGKIILAGYTDEVGGSSNVFLCRLSVNGAEDTSFGTQGWVVTAPPGDAGGSFLDAAIQSNGRILAIGRSSVFEVNSDVLLARYLTELDIGMLDASRGSDRILTCLNPIHDDAVLRFELARPSLISVDLIDGTGRTVKCLLINEQCHQGKQEVRFDSSDLSAGSYVLRVSFGLGQTVLTVIKQ